MTEGQVSTLIEPLAAWASGIYAREAVVELLSRVAEGEFLRPAWPWMMQISAGRRWIDAAQITPDNIGALSGSEQSVLLLCASLLGGSLVQIGAALTSLDSHTADLVIAALAHATGLRDEPVWYVCPDGRPTGGTNGRALHPWPAT